MTNQQPPELFPSDRPVQSTTITTKSYRARRVFTCAVLAMLIGGGVYEIYLWKQGPTEIPYIKAEASLKQKPDQPGGIDIPNQDVMAYQQIDSDHGKSQAERLLPPPETPQQAAAIAPSKDEAPTPDAAPSSAVSSIETLSASPAPVPIPTTVTDVTPTTIISPSVPAHSEVTPTAAPPMAVQKAEVVSSPAPLPEETKPVAAAPASTPSPAKTAARVEKSPTKGNDSVKKATAGTADRAAAAKGSMMIQLASYPDEDLAKSEMAKMQNRFSSQLGSAKLHLAKADLGSRGIFYRVQSSTMPDSDARSLCSALKDLKAGCIVVKP